MLPGIDLNTYLLFVSAAVALILTPGPDTVFVLTQGVSGGKRGVAALGVSTGILVNTTAASWGSPRSISGRSACSRAGSGRPSSFVRASRTVCAGRRVRFSPN